MMIMRNLTENRYVALFSFLLLSAFILAGCSQKPITDGGRIVIKFAGEEAGEEGRLMKKLISSFEESYPNIKIEIVSTAGSRYSEKVLIMTAAGMAPDIFMVILHYGDLAYLVEKGTILALDDLMGNDPDFSKDDFFEAPFKGLTYEGKIYGLPKDLNPQLLYYNKKLFDEAGVEYPNKNWTWDNFLETSRKLTRDIDGDGHIDVFGGGWRMALGYHTQSIAILIWQNGGSMFNSKGTRCLLDSPQAIESLEYYARFNQEGLVPGQAIEREMGWWQTFAMGKVAMLISGPYTMTTLNKVKELEYDVTLLPSKNGNRTTRLSFLGWAISSQTKHPQEAWQFLKYIGGAPGQHIVAQTKHGVPTVKAIANSPEYGPPPENIKIGLEAVECSRVLPSFIGFKEAREIIIRGLDLVGIGKKTVREAAPEIVKEVNKLLAEQK
jgi:multiple sugar transport system substrate-binding protein